MVPKLFPHCYTQIINFPFFVHYVRNPHICNTYNDEHTYNIYIKKCNLQSCSCTINVDCLVKRIWNIDGYAKTEGNKINHPLIWRGHKILPYFEQKSYMTKR